MTTSDSTRRAISPGGALVGRRSPSNTIAGGRRIGRARSARSCSGWHCSWRSLAIVLQLRTSEAQAEMFFSSASLVLIAELLLIWDRLRSDRGSTLVSAGRGALVRLAVRNAARHPVRSTLTIGLMAAATFLIVSMSAFRFGAAGARPEAGQRRRRFLAVRANRSADLSRFEHARRPRRLGLRREIRGVACRDAKSCRCESIPATTRVA